MLERPLSHYWTSPLSLVSDKTKATYFEPVAEVDPGFSRGGGGELGVGLQKIMCAQYKAPDSQSPVQWNLVITRSLGPWKLPCYIRFLIISR